MRKLADKNRPDDNNVNRQPGSFTIRLSGIMTGALRLLPAFTVVLVLVTLVLYAAFGPG